MSEPRDKNPPRRGNKHVHGQGVGKTLLYSKNTLNFIFTYINNTWIYFHY